MKVIHLAIATNEIDKSVKDYTERLGKSQALLFQMNMHYGEQNKLIYQ